MARSNTNAGEHHTADPKTHGTHIFETTVNPSQAQGALQWGFTPVPARETIRHSVHKHKHSTALIDCPAYSTVRATYGAVKSSHINVLCGIPARTCSFSNDVVVLVRFPLAAVRTYGSHSHSGITRWYRNELWNHEWTVSGRHCRPFGTTPPISITSPSVCPSSLPRNRPSVLPHIRIRHSLYFPTKKGLDPESAILRTQQHTAMVVLGRDEDGGCLCCY